jgi:hypothetical protein
MQANPDKFQVLAVGKKTYEKRPTIKKGIIVCIIIQRTVFNEQKYIIYEDIE